MNPLSAQHRIERTAEGEVAWRTQALSPDDRSVLGSLRRSQTVAELLNMGQFSPGEMEAKLYALARRGWVLMHEPTVSAVEVVEEAEEASVDNDDELAAILQRHREEEERTAAELASLETPVEVVPERALRVERPELMEALPFDAQLGESDGLLDALKNPDLASTSTASNYEWAPPSGGLAALLRALGEPVPPDVELSPDHQEHMSTLEPIEPWGGALSSSSVDEPESKAPSDPAFPRLKDQPAERDRPRPELGALRASLGKLHQENAQAEAQRERARQIRQQREDQLAKAQQQHALHRKQEEKQQDNKSLLGLSAKLARLKNERDKN